ncbi:MAG: RNase H-like domain-containing protein [Candidatus Thiodiazotropha endolucinida]|nr:DDE-type integrase/transposase/recombinase [Candidatus Thiodiazotropha taylori]MCW4264200.1 RNase H-like domain-containing protein [Candidatus Thiodiazotropha endolucinida]
MGQASVEPFVGNDPHVSLPPKDGLYLDIKVENCPFIALIDTGSTVSIIHPKKFESLSSETQEKVLPTKCVLKMADGGPVDCRGTIILPISIGDKIYDQQVLIAEIEAPFVLGYDFLHDHQCILNISQAELSFPDQSMQCRLESEMPKIFKIALCQTVEIPANSEIVVPASFCEHAPHFSTAIAEDYSDKLSERGVLVAKTVFHTYNDVVPLRLLNLNGFPLKLYKNETAAVCDPVTIEQDNFDDQQNVNEQLYSVTTESFENIALPEHLQEMYESCLGDLTEEEASTLKSLLLKHSKVFSASKSDLGNCGIIPHRINTGTAPPVRLPPRRIPMTMKQAVEDEVQRLIDNNLVEKSKSPWAFPLVPIRKKDSSIRICIDYRQLNLRTLPDSYPLPRVQECLDALDGATLFSTLDCTSGFFQLQMHPDDKDKTAFVCSKGLFNFKVLPMGLVNSPATYQRLMEHIMTGINFQTCLVYLDDCIIFSKSFNEHISRLDEVLTRISKANLKFRPDKCNLLRREVKFLGHVVSAEGVATCEDKIRAVKEWPIPSNVKELLSFLGLASYYRRFCKSFGTISAPLHKLTKKNQAFEWSPECQEAFDTLKELLTNAPILGYPNTHDQYFLDTDASSVAVGAVLSQVQNGQERVIAYFSKSLNDAQRKYCVTRRELLAIVEAVKHFHQYLYGVSFIVRTDHGSIRWLRNFKNPNSILARWLEVLSTYRFEIKFRPGSLNRNSDGLSRRPCTACSYCDKREEEDQKKKIKCCKISHLGRAESKDRDMFNYDSREITPKTEEENKVREKTVESSTSVDGNSVATNSFPSELKTDSDSSIHIRSIHCSDGNSEISWENDQEFVQWKEAQVLDPTLSVLYNWVENNKRPEWEDISGTDEETKTYWAQWPRLVLHKGVLCRKYFDGKTDTHFLQILVPFSCRKEVLCQLHDHLTSGHLATTKTTEKVKKRFYWYKYKEFIENWIMSCDKCQARRLPKLRPRAPMKQSRVGTPLERVCLDLLGPFPESRNKNKYILSICDQFTRWIEMFPLKNMEAETVATVFVSEFVSRYGLCRQILTDQGKQFESKLFKGICELLDIDKKRSTSFHPQTNGIQERFNRTIEDMLSKYVSANQRDWDEYLPMLLLAYRSSIHESTKQTPYTMFFGRHAILPVDLVCCPPSSENRKESHEYVLELQERLRKVHSLARTEMIKASDRQKKTYDHRVRTIPYNEGDLVWLRLCTRSKRICPKLQPRWEGPYTITRKISDLVVEIEMPEKKKSRKIVHHNRIIPYVR